MKTTMDMDNYEIEQDMMDIEYGEEIMHAGWNPAVDLVCELLQVPIDEEIAMAAELPEMDNLLDVSMAISDIFMRKMHSFSR